MTLTHKEWKSYKRVVKAYVRTHPWTKAHYQRQLKDIKPR